MSLVVVVLLGEICLITHVLQLNKCLDLNSQMVSLYLDVFRIFLAE